MSYFYTFSFLFDVTISFLRHMHREPIGIYHRLNGLSQSREPLE